ncbi:hypothetical protein GCM10027287_40350 [Bordetella muralis]|jgi:hypothetical protein
MITPPATDLANLDADALRQLLQDSWAERQALEDKIRFKDTRIAQLTHEITGVGVCGVQLQPLADALRQAILTHRVVHADETPVQQASRCGAVH